MSVVVYSKSNCPQCTQTKKMLEKLGVDFKEESLEDEKNAEKLAEFKSQGISSAPVVVSDKGTWGGFKMDKIKSLAV